MRDQLIAAVSPSGSPVMSEGTVGGSRDMEHVRMYTTSFCLVSCHHLCSQISTKAG